MDHMLQQEFYIAEFSEYEKLSGIAMDIAFHKLAHIPYV